MVRGRRPRVRRSVTGVVTVALLAIGVACADRQDDSLPNLTGARVEVVGVWRDAEAEAFERVLDEFAGRTGATVIYTSTGGEDVTAVLDRRLAADDPPDLAVVPQPGTLRELAERGSIVPVGGLVGDVVRRDWAPVWQRLGTVDDELYGLWFKAANKSLIWYSITSFERVGVVPPDDLDALGAVADELAAAGIPAFSRTGAPSDAWTTTDWFENLYLRLAGPDRYDALAERRLPWTDASVEETLRALAGLLSPDRTTLVEGADTTFPQSVAGVFATEPSAAMVMEGDFVPGVVVGATDAELGVDVDVFAFPGRSPSDRFVVGGGDAVVMLSPSPAAEALVRWLATADAATVWARLGGFVSPNEAVDLAVYPDATTRRIARSLLEAGDGFRFDLSDLQPAAFGATTGAGMWAELERFLADPSDLRATTERLEAAAATAWGER